MNARQQGFTLFEMVIAITLVVLLYVTMMDRLMPLRGDAEAANVATIAGSLRSALGMEVADRLLHGEAASISELEGSNPMRLLAEIPENYLGEVDGVNPANLPTGSWYFDSSAGELVYLVRYTDYFRTEMPGPPRMVFRVQLVHNERDQLAGVRLARMNSFVWTQSADLAELLRNFQHQGE
jgi:prepilin-type N-terminal cleavage/methylation domain-containing protein